MATEEQTTQNGYTTLYGDVLDRLGQRLTISNRIVSKLSFPLCKSGSPTGNLTFTIRRVSTDVAILSKLWGARISLNPWITWEEVEFDTPATINEEVRILVETDGDSDDPVLYYMQNTDVKASEYFAIHQAGGIYGDVPPYTGYDGAYKYTYEEGGAQTIYPTSIASAEAFGTSKLNLKVTPSAISSLEAFGSPKLNQRIFANAISSLEAFGTAKINQRILAQAIASAEAFGTPMLHWAGRILKVKVITTLYRKIRIGTR